MVSFLHHMGLFRWFARKLMSLMGYAYVWLDRRVEYSKEEVREVLGLTIDEDLQTSSRYELCQLIEKEFKVPKDSYSTCKMFVRCIDEMLKGIEDA